MLGAARIEDADKIRAHRQRRPDGNGIARRRPVREPVHLVEIRQRRIIAEFFIHLQRRRGRRQRRVGRVKRHVGVASRRVHIINEPFARRHARVNAQPDQIAVRLDDQAELADPARHRQRIIHLAQDPHERLLPAETHEAARPIGIRRAGRRVAAVIINFRQRAVGVAKAVVVVQHHVLVVGRQRAEQVAEILMFIQTRHRHLLDDHRRFGRAEGQRHARMRVVAVGNVLRQRKPVDHQVAVLIQTAERNVREDRQEGVFRSHLVFRLHADIINVARRGIGGEDKFRPERGERRAAETRLCVNARQTVGNRHRIQIRDGWVRRHIQINVRLRARGVGHAVGINPHARN